MDRKAFDKITEVENFLMKLRYESPDVGGRSIPYDSMAYGEALEQWRKRGHPSNSYFSTDDPSVLEFAAELRREFGLEVVTREEGLAREKAMPTKQTRVSGFEWSERAAPVDKKLWN
jgi:hypothetical protein